MEKFQELRDNAKKRLQLADHILTMTYPIANDPKLLLAVTENIFLSLTNGMGSILHFERTFKRIPPFNDTFNGKFALFSEYTQKKKLDKEYLNLIKEVKSIIVKHKKSPVEFVRKDRFIICNGNYRMKEVSVNELKSFISKSKNFLTLVNTIINNDEGLYSRVQ